MIGYIVLVVALACGSDAACVPSCGASILAPPAPAVDLTPLVPALTSALSSAISNALPSVLASALPTIETLLASALPTPTFLAPSLPPAPLAYSCAQPYAYSAAPAPLCYY